MRGMSDQYDKFYEFHYNQNCLDNDLLNLDIGQYPDEATVFQLYNVEFYSCEWTDVSATMARTAQW